VSLCLCLSLFLSVCLSLICIALSLSSSLFSLPLSSMFRSVNSLALGLSVFL
jgi:hypothetical protein